MSDIERRDGQGEDERALELLGELMSYDNFEAYPPYLVERVREYMAESEALRSRLADHIPDAGGMVEPVQAAPRCAHDPDLPCIPSKCDAANECASRPAQAVPSEEGPEKVPELIERILDQVTIGESGEGEPYLKYDMAAMRQLVYGFLSLRAALLRSEPRGESK